MIYSGSSMAHLLTLRDLSRRQQSQTFSGEGGGG